MGVRVKTYVIFGFKIDFSDEINEMIYENDELENISVSDGMSGEYIVLGDILASFSEYGDDEQFYQITDMSLNPETKKLIEDNFDIDTSNPCLYVFRHYT